MNFKIALAILLVLVAITDSSGREPVVLYALRFLQSASDDLREPLGAST